MPSDNEGIPTYAQLMLAERGHITLTLDLHDPIEVSDFVALFAAISDQYERYVRSEFPDAPKDAKIFIQEIRKGSIIADLFPGGWGDLIKYMDQTLIVTGFAFLVAKIIKRYIDGQWLPDATKADLKNYLGTVRAVANDSDGKAILETAIYRQGVWKREVVLNFTTTEAKEAAKQIEQQKQEIDLVSRADHERVLMIFKRSDRGDAEVGKRSGERVVIEQISDRDLPLIAEQRIKHEIRDADDNIYKKGFVVDVNVETRDQCAAAGVSFFMKQMAKKGPIPDDLFIREIPDAVC